MEKPQILWVAHSYASQGGGVKNHQHPYYHMIFVLTGKLNFTIDEKTFTVDSENCVLIPRKNNHTYINNDETTVEYLEIKFSLTKDSLDSQLCRRGVCVSDNKIIGMLFRQILNEYATFDNRSEQATASYLLALLNLFGESERHNREQQFRYIDASDYSKLSQQIIKYLEEHYHEDLSLDSLAAALNRNKSYLCDSFRKDTHSTILDSLNFIRIRKAAELVVYSEYNLTRVSELCGFASVSHFNRVFLKYVGITPGQCRRAYPSEILITPDNKQYADRTKRFMYSVLAQKRITQEMIKGLDLLEQEGIVAK